MARKAESILTVFSTDLAEAIRAFDALESARVPAAGVSVLASGIEVDRRLIHSGEINANRVAGDDQGARTEISGLARKLLAEKRFLLEGCWAVGPLFQDWAGDPGSREPGALTRSLLGQGFGIQEAAVLESALKEQGGVWLAARGPPKQLEAVERAWRALKSARVKRSRSFSRTPSGRRRSGRRRVRPGGAS